MGDSLLPLAGSQEVEFGVILRFAARIDGSEFDVTEVAEIVFGEELPEELFRLDLPGVEFRRLD